MATLASFAAPHQDDTLTGRAGPRVAALPRSAPLDGMNRRLDALREGIVEPQCSVPTGRR
jgi:hypothetical protein